MYEQEFTLRHYIVTVLSNWKVIFAVTLGAAVAAAAVTFAQAEMYEAEAAVAILRFRTEVEFDPRIRTLSDYELGGNTLAGRQDSLIALVTSNSVVQQVQDQVAENLEPETRNVTSLRRMVEVEASGDLININVRHADPQIAAEIANAWIQIYERHVNNVYSSAASVNSNIASQLEAAQERYEAAQQELEEFAAQDPVPALQREIAERQAVLEGYQQTLVSMQINPVITQEAVLQAYYAELQRIEGWLGDARALSQQVRSDDNSAAANLGNSLALVLLRSRVFGGENSVSSQSTSISSSRDNSESSGDRGDSGASSTILQVDLGEIPDGGIGQSDVETLIQVLEQRREAIWEQIGALESALNEGEVAAAITPADSRLVEGIRALEEEIAGLRGEVEAESARRRELEQARDSAWETVQVLQGKQVEEEIATDAPGAEVRIADMALIPTRPQSRGLLTNIALAGLVGLMIAVGAVISADWWVSGEPASDDEKSGAGGDKSKPEHESEVSGPVPTRSRRVPDSIT